VKLLKTTLPPILTLCVVISGWHFFKRWGTTPDYLLPGPRQVLAVLWPAVGMAGADPLLMQEALDQRRQLLEALWGTTQGALAGLGLSIAVGAGFASILATSRWARAALFPYAIFFQTVPIIAIAPLLVIWLGFGLRTVIASAFIASVFPIVANTLAGLLGTDPNLVDLFRLYGGTGLRGKMLSLLKLRVPAALPQTFTGLRIGGGLAVIGAIVGEFIGGGGLGSVVDVARTQQRTDVVFAAVLLASVLGLALFCVLGALSWALLRKWDAATRAG
jgi:NitT/TauT family transport system permease protein